MQLVQMQPRPATADPVHSTAADAMDVTGPQVWHDMTVEVALSVSAAAGTGHLVLCDEDGQYVGLVTRARLVAVRNSRGYTDRIRLSDITDGSGSFAEHGGAPGVLALAG
ncbi:CBS domain-containing protein [Streptomyces sp. SID12488]|uniref:CBS domain-containing protein n=1 Tax=Streptomyces sp. SID12488 TaxID=2706040 RepID=UPI0013DD868A|nr:CBS domain-containing protein [Streptomyces sp. SID12488]NEA67514.1 CBS domain-containing protein [Streptomyces sp. SID12488]